MKRAVAVVLVSLAVAIGIGQLMAAPPQPATDANVKLLARGKYLVENASLCSDCHTMRDQRGEPVQEKALQGAPILFTPTVPVPAWADKAPNIAGLPGWTDEQAIKFMMTGIAYNDLPANPPMPPFRFNREDATAIVAYLRSLKPVPNPESKTDLAKKSAGQ